MIRLLSPVDLPQLISIQSMLAYDEAHTSDNLGGPQHIATAMGVFLGQWVSLNLRQKQQSWVCTGENGLQGFVSVRSHNESFSWEIDHLLLKRNDSNSICSDLLHAVVSDLRRSAAHRIFLRLAADSPLIEPAQRVGFTPYLRECLYQLNTMWTAHKTGTKSWQNIRPLNKKDEYHLFELYNVAFPATVRCIEGVTFTEWREVRGSLACPQWKSQFVAEDNGNIIAQCNIASRGNIGQFEVIIHPDADVEEIIGYAGAYLSNYPTIRCLVPQHDSILASSLAGHGFVPVAEYDALANLSAIRVQEEALLPIRI